MSQSDPQSPPGSPDSPTRALSVATSSANTEATSLSDFYAAVASTPPCIDDWVAYPYDLSESSTREARATHFPTEPLPSSGALERAAALPVFDRTGQEVPFGSLYQGRQYYGQQRLVVFIRHFYCRACKGFVRHLRDYFATAAAKTATVNGHTIDKSIVIVGCGHPSLIEQYIGWTQCPYPVYADPSQKVMRMLGCSKWAGIMPGPRADYAKSNGNALVAVTTSLVDIAKAFRPVCPADCDQDHEDANGKSKNVQCSANGRPLRRKFSKDGLRGGPWLQVGGEFLFEQGELVWCHRMRSSRGHTAPHKLKQVLDPVDANPPPPPAKDRPPRTPMTPSSAAGSSPDLKRSSSSHSDSSDRTPTASTQVWSQAEYTLLPGSHIIQQASAGKSADDKGTGNSRSLPIRTSPTTRDFPRSRMSRPRGTIRESSKEL